ncbi:unnamed protein product [Dracunculus medinensis]|uniref:Oxaloacetate tautomerase FAHD1, mitochondrial n=1 Tax=Dracunculus medinensis TaxID=318479 RepID=A0A0N4UKP7_DRAME|nr:unnamed protein product [Dracunculus medinensis]
MANSLKNFWQIGKKIVCVGRNYKDHALELGNVVPRKPIFFLKSTNSYVIEDQPILIPPGCVNLHQEVELGVVIGKLAKNVKSVDAFDYIGGYTVALDMTARDLQDEFKKAGNPWFIAKSFDTSCPITKFIDVKEIIDPHQEELFCKVNGKEQQRCKTDKMIFNIPFLLEYLTQYVTLQTGDLLLTGTPAGVTQVNSGDILEFGLEGKLRAKYKVL